MKLTIFHPIKRALRRWERKFVISKRQQFVLITALLTLGLVLTQLVGAELRYPGVAGLGLLTFILSAFSLREDIKGVEWMTLLILPTFFTVAIGLFYFLLPVRWLTRLPVAILYAVGIYALLLTENIYNVAASHTIALLRAAHSVGFLLTLVTYFLLIQTVLAYRLAFYVNTLLVAVISFFLLLQLLWAMELAPFLSRQVIKLTLTSALVLGELAWIFSFWPAKITLLALFLTTTLYSLGGMAQAYLVERLYKKTVIEFFAVGLIVFVLLLFTTTWRGNF